MLAEMVAWQPPRAGRPAGSISSRSIAVSRNRLFLVGLLPRRQVGTQGWSVAVEQRDVCGALTPLQPTRPTVNERSIDVLPMPGNLICYRQQRPDQVPRGRRFGAAKLLSRWYSEVKGGKHVVVV